MFTWNTSRILLRTRFTWNTPRILENKVYLEYSKNTGEQCLPKILPGYWRTMFTWNTSRIQGLPKILPGYWRNQNYL